MSELADPHVAEALLALGGSSVAISDAGAHVPNQRGLYAIHASKEVWAELGVPLRDVPLYVGKAERSLVSRDLRTHFETGKTGSSTLRRSLAALLCDSLDLVAVPRNLAIPSHFSNFALEWDGDVLLTEWMRVKLTIAVWAAPASASELVKIERAVLARWEPPLNLKDVPHPSPQLKAARAKMADRARASARTPTSPASPTHSDVIQFIARYFEEDEAVATRRLRRRRYGWEVDTQPMTGELLLGPGPFIVDGRTGDYWETSSSPADVFGGSGTLGWSELKTRSLFEKWKSEHPGPDGNVFTERHC